MVATEMEGEESTAGASEAGRLAGWEWLPQASGPAKALLLLSIFNKVK